MRNGIKSTGCLVETSVPQIWRECISAIWISAHFKFIHAMLYSFSHNATPARTKVMGEHHNGVYDVKETSVYLPKTSTVVENAFYGDFLF